MRFKKNNRSKFTANQNTTEIPLDNTKKNWRSRADDWLNRHRKPVLIGVIIFATLLAVIIIYLINSLQFFATVSQKQIARQKFYSPLTGVEVTESQSKNPVIGVMIENSPEARPQSGLKQAGVVFESIAEGGITRFLALYQESLPPIIGPVRSVRPQFASWVAAFDGGLAHVGGSSIPLAKLRSGQIKDLDQFFNENSYWRSIDRYAPHNVYTSGAKLSALNKSKHYNSSNFTAWQRKKKPTHSKTPNAQALSIPVSTGQFAVTYKYSAKSNSYLRFEGGIPHNDREKGQISPKVVIALQIRHNIIKDTNGYSYPDVIGSGSGWLFQDGTVTKIKWTKNSDKSQIKFTDADGKAVQLESGQTWITDIASTEKPTWQ